MIVVSLVNLHLTGVGATAQYIWNCSEPDAYGERYIPGVRQYPNDVLTNTTAGGVINIYRVQNLNAECYVDGEVTAIEYCYRYNTDVLGEPVFNWTVLFFTENSKDFTITDVFAIQSRPSSEKCSTHKKTSTEECCDVTFIEGFELQRNNFIFGVTESAQGNTAGATLLAFFYDDDSFGLTQPEYAVFTVQVSKGQTALSVGSSLPTPGPGGGVNSGLCMLWFVIGKPILY